MDKNKIQKGMVFSYNINPRINKLEHPSISVNGKIYHDYNTYGYRPWIVVSVNNNHMCSVVPMSTGQAFTELENDTRVDLRVDDTDSCALCEKIRTINSVELGKYITTLTKEDIEKIDRAILNHLGIHYTNTNNTDTDKPKAESTDTIKVDSLIESICKDDRFNSYIKGLVKGYADSIQGNPNPSNGESEQNIPLDSKDINTTDKNIPYTNTTNKTVDTSNKDIDTTTNTSKELSNTDTSDNNTSTNTNTKEITPIINIKDMSQKDIRKMIRSSIKYLNTAYKSDNLRLKGIK